MRCSEQTAARTAAIIAALVECARQGQEPDAQLRDHMGVCPACAERWQTERQLAAELRGMRLVAASAAMATRETRRAAVLAEFDRKFNAQPPSLAPNRWIPKWTTALAVAAALVFAVLAGNAVGSRRHPQPPPATRIRALPTGQSILYEASMDASEISGDDFIAVPYTPPLAQGELVRVIRAELYPEALTSMGIDVDPSSGSNIPAEIVVGEDGLPRAVRIADESQ